MDVGSFKFREASVPVDVVLSQLTQVSYLFLTGFVKEEALVKF